MRRVWAKEAGSPKNHVWTDDDDQRLTEGWLTGRSCVTLAKEFGVTKNAIVGRKNRLELPNRISPIQGGVANFKGQGAKRVGLVTLAPIAPPAPVVLVRSDPPREVPVRSRSACCWPIGHPGTKAFRFCDDAAIPGRPYCEPHCAIAYTGRRRPVEAA